MLYHYLANVEGHYDGDSIYLSVDLGCHVWIKGELCRWYGIDAPEKYAPGGKVSLQSAQYVTPVGSKILVKTEKDREKYGRYLVTIWDGAYAKLPPEEITWENSWNHWMVTSGFAKPYYGKGPRGGIVDRIVRFVTPTAPTRIAPITVIDDIPPGPPRAGP